MSANNELLYSPRLKENGFTLIEVLVSAAIMLTFLPFAASMLTNSQLMASYSRHKIQAAYAAEQIIETERQEPISFFAPQLAVIKPANNANTWSVALDTKGNYTNTNCAQNISLFCGTATITVTPVSYTNSAGTTTKPQTAIYTPVIGAPYSYYTSANVQVQISWAEQVLNVKVPMNEYYVADIIVNDPMLN